MAAAAVVARHVTHERLGDEVMAINLESGVYFSMDGVAADCWTLVSGGVELDAVVAMLVERYECDPTQVRADVERLLEELVRDGLVTWDNAGTPGTPDADGLLPEPPAGPYTTPVVQKFEDLQDLLLLDPIHEVDEAGWPVTRAEGSEP